MLELLNNIGILGVPLFALSFIGVVLIAERTFFFIKLPQINKSKTLEKLSTHLANNKNKPKQVRDEMVCFMLCRAKKPYFFGIRLLRIIAVISPMVGLLGTVVGIIEAFKIIAAYDGPVYPALIADGLWTAMLTTAVGLIIALPCLLAAFVFARMAENRICEYECNLNEQSLKYEGVRL